MLRRTATSALVLVAIAAVLGLLASPSSHAAVGDVVFRGCIADGGHNGCFDTGPDPLDGAYSVAVSPDSASRGRKGVNLPRVLTRRIRQSAPAPQGV